MANILLLKIEKPDDPFLKALAEHNHNGVCIPALSFQYMNINELTQRLKSAEDYAGLIFTSQNSVEACHKSQESSQVDLLSRWRNKSNYVVGESTRAAGVFKAAASRLLSLECRGAESGNADALANLIHLELKSEDTFKFLYPKTSLKTIDMSGHLTALGFQVEELEVYNTVADPDFGKHLTEYAQSLSSLPKAVVFFSPSGVDHCLDQMKSVLSDSVQIIAVGPSTSLRLKQNGIDEHFVLNKPNGESLIQCINNQLVLPVS